MPVSVELTAEGIWTWLHENGTAKQRQLVGSDIKKAQKQALAEWATRGRPGKQAPPASLAARFGSRAMETFNLTRRSPAYEKRVRAFFGGRYLPYTAPRHGATTQSLEGKHMRDLVTLPGSGHSITGMNTGSAAITTKITIKKAKPLNFHATYRREFLSFNRKDRHSPKWITDRGNALALQLVLKRFSKGRTRIILKRGRT